MIFEEIGFSVENRSIYSVILTKNKSSENFNDLPIMVFTGVHHAREPITLTMNLYIILKILFDSIREETTILEHAKLLFVPIVNVDGYAKVFDIYNNTNILSELVRKNRRANDNCSKYFQFSINKSCFYKSFIFVNEGWISEWI